MKTRLKTYTMTWKVYGKFGSKGYSRCREHIWPFPQHLLPFDEPLAFFLWLISDHNHNYGSAHKDFRLSSCGRLIARQATYQGV